MGVQTLGMSLGVVGALQVSGYSTGWYRDPVTGQRYYYNASEGMWYIYTAGVLVPLAILEEAGPKVVAVTIGESVKISISYKYAGPAVTGVEEYFSIGIKGLTYSPKITGTNTRNLPTCGTATLFTSEKTLVIPSDVGSNWTAIECKVWRGSPEVPETGKRYTGALSIVGLTATITEFTIVSYDKV